MPDQDYAVLAVLLFTMLLIALVYPAPERPPRNEAPLNLALLGAGATLAIAAGILGLSLLPVPGAVCGALAWMSVLPCLWMARAPRPAHSSWEDEADEDDGGGGEPSPLWPGTPRSPDGLRPDPAFSGWDAAPAHVAWARPPAQPSRAPVVPQPAIARACEQPAPSPQRRRLKPRPRLARGDHRSIVHKRVAAPHAGRRRRANLRRRVLTRCRSWLWVEPPERVSFVEPEHEWLGRRPGADQLRDSRSASLV